MQAKLFEALGELGDLLLNHWLAAGQDDILNSPVAPDIRQNRTQMLRFHFRLPGGVRRVAPMAPEIASTGSDKDRRCADQHALALHRVEDLRNIDHVAYSIGSWIPASSNPRRRSRQESHAPQARSFTGS